MKQTTISVQDISGTWAQIGAGRLRGIQPSDVELTSDSWGAKDATFNLTRELYVPWPEIQAYAPVEVTVGGVVVWRGRIVDAPTNSASRTIAVRCEGWQAHLDDDQFEHVYVVTDLSVFKDVRSLLETDLSKFPADGQVDIGEGLRIGWSHGVSWPTAKSAGVYMEVPRGQSIRRVVVQLRNLAGSPNGPTIYCRTANSPADIVAAGGSFTEGTGSFPKAVNSLTSNGAAAFFAQSFSSANRGLGIFVYNEGSTYTPGPTDGHGDAVVFDSIQIFTNSAYESGNVSVLRGDTVVQDALASATVKLSSDVSLIDSTGTSFYIPEFAPDGPRTARQTIEAANAFYDFRTRIDESDRFVFEDRTGEAPAVSVGRWGSSSFEDASSASGDEVYNKVIVTGQAASGNPVRSVRHSATESSAQLVPSASPYIANPDFTSNTTGWVFGGTSTLTWVSTGGHGSAGRARWDRTGATDDFNNPTSMYTPFAGDPFRAGITYVCSVWLYNTGAVGRKVYLTFGWDTDYVEERCTFTTTGAWEQFSLAWVPTANRAASTCLFGFRVSEASGPYMFVDDMALSTATPTIVDRRGFVRAHTLDASFMLTDSSAERLGTIYLEAHRTTPFKGQGQAVGHNALRDYRTGLPIGPERLLTMTDKPMFFDDRIDPDTGAVGRVGRLVNVRYTPATDTATFDIDNSRKDFDALLERLGVSIGQIR